MSDSVATQVTPLIRGYDNVLLDMDGCLWLGEQAIPGAPEAVAALRAAGKRVAFVTNDARSTPEELERKFERLGIPAAPEEIVTSGSALQFVLSERYDGRDALAVVIGAPAIHRHVEAAGLRIVNGTDAVRRADVAVVSGHDRFDFQELKDGMHAVVYGGAALIATARDATKPMADGLWPGSGAILSAVETATGRRAELVGKPEAGLIRTALARLGPGRSLMVGDRIDADLGAAAAAGVAGAIVLTGVADADAAAKATAPAPVAVADSLSALVFGPGSRSRP